MVKEYKCAKCGSKVIRQRKGWWVCVNSFCDFEFHESPINGKSVMLVDSSGKIERIIPEDMVIK